jgi:alkylation response protein AidB-like acyl-CoA dehydrogenase
VDLAPSPAQERFRAELRDWLATAVTWGDGDRPPQFADLDDEVAFLRQWQRTLAGGGWVGVHWPSEYGGRGLGPIESFIVAEELARVRSPELVGRIGVNLVGPTLLAHGSDAQKQRWLPAILDAREIWCQLFSEPGAGSDLASLTTRALRDTDGGWVLDGAKVWTSYAQYADWGLCLARTSPDQPKTKGITAFAVDMRAPGVTVRPLVQMTGDREFNEVRLDEVRVPDDHRVGDVDAGWRVAGSTLAGERATNPRQLVIHLQAVDELVRLAAATGADADPRIRRRLAMSYADVRIFQLHTWRALSRLEHGERLGPEGSMVKLHWSEASKRLHALAMDVLGDAAPLWRGAAGNPGDGRWQRAWLYYQASSIWAGTNEIQRNVIGERVLGLPRERVPQRSGGGSLQ